MPIERWWRYLAAPNDDCRGALLDLARNATSSLHAIIYSWTLSALADEFIAAHQRGLTVGVVADQSQSTGALEHPLLQGLVDAGVPVTITTSQWHKIQHDKVLIVDYALGALHNQAHIAWGSVNWSGNIADPHSGSQGQNNILEISNDASLCQFLYEQYEALLVWGENHCLQMTPSVVK